MLDARPRSVCPVTTAYLDALEAGLAEADRRRVLPGLRTRLGAGRLSAGSSIDKAAAAADWLVRVAAPIWLEAVAPDPRLLAALRAGPGLRGETNTRRARLTMERSVQQVLQARMSACNVAWNRRRSEESLAAEGQAMLDRFLPRMEKLAFARSGYGAALGAVDCAPPVPRWATLHDHLVGLGQAAVAALAWDAAWTTAACRTTGTWATACERRLEREVNLLVGQLQPHSIALGGLLVAG